MRWLSASAVCFIGPQRPSCTIENERSTQSATAALIPRSVSVVMASAGYPEGSSTGDVIVGTETLAVEDDVDVVHAGTARTDAGLVTAGGRVLAVRATGTDVADARAKAYEGISSISFPGAQWRRDIAAEPLGVVGGAASRG